VRGSGTKYSGLNAEAKNSSLKTTQAKTNLIAYHSLLNLTVKVEFLDEKRKKATSEKCPQIIY